MDVVVNPFSALSFIVAPAVLTNACSVLSLGTSNRLARAVDRTRQLTSLLEASNDDSHSPRLAVRSRELAAAHERVQMLIRALRSFYLALGGFAAAALVSALGALGIGALPAIIAYGTEVLAGIFGSIAVFSLIRGSWLLVRETRIAVEVLEEEATRVQLEFAEKQKRLPA